MLCDVCMGMLRHRRNEIKFDGHIRTFGHHYGIVSLKQSAMNDCYICLPLWRKLLDIDQEHLRVFEQGQSGSAVDQGQNNGLAPIHTWISIGYLSLTPGFERLEIDIPLHLFGDRDESLSIFTLKSPAGMPSRLVESSTTSSSSLHCARRRLDECLCSHETCVRDIEGPAWYPTRLLHVRHHSSSTNHVRLIHSAREQPQGPYLTLSHRWGENETLKLTRDNIETFASAIDVPSLPQTFSDALCVTVALGYQYLWIDSLCIIQDEADLSDWSHEAGLMHKVYLHSRCNISASIAKNSEEGLSRYRDPNSFYGHIASIRVDKSRLQNVHRDFWLERSRIWTDNIPQCHLNTRGWVFQERILSPRVLHFCNDQFFWECRSHRACERYPLGHRDLFPDVSSDKGERVVSKLKGLLEKKDIRRGPGINKVETGISFWMDLMIVYSSTILSHPADRLIALSGIANQMSLLVRDTYVAGMWRETLPYDLLWYRTRAPPGISDSVNMSHKSRNYTAPSWSWASVNCPIGMWSMDWNTFLFEILNVRLQHATDDITGRVIGGWMTLRVQLNPLFLWYDPAKKEWKATLSNVESAMSIFSPFLDEPAIDLNHFGDDNVNRRLYYIPAAYCNIRGDEIVMVLLLRTVEGEAGVFTRFGLAYQWGQEGNGWNLVRQILTELDENEKQKLPSLDYQDGKHIIRVI